MGGAQYQVKCLLDELIKMDRYDISYIANRISSGYHPKEYQLFSVGSRSPRFGFVTHARPLTHLLERLAPDLIYQRVACGYTGIAARYAKRHNVKMVWHVAHDSDVTSDKTIHGRNPLRRYLEKNSVAYGIRHASCVITQTRDQAELMERNFARRADAIVPNFHPAPQEPVDKSGRPLVVWVANLKPWKQPEAFVRLAAALADISDVRFVMVGALMAEGRDTRWGESLIRSIDETENLEYRGSTSQTEVNELLARAHLFVNTSRHEGFANTFIQAWMREVPVVSLHVDPDRVLSTRRIGARCGSEDELQRVVRYLLSHEQERRALGRTARTYALEHHSTRNAYRIADLFEEAVGGQHRVNEFPPIRPGMTREERGHD